MWARLCQGAVGALVLYNQLLGDVTTAVGVLVGGILIKGGDATGTMTLLPVKRSLALFEAPSATITFMDGDPAVATAYL